MSDFFMSNQEEENKQDFNTNVESENTQVNQNIGDFNSRIQSYKNKKREHYANVEEFGVDIPDEYYEAFRPILVNCKTQAERQEEAYKLATAAKYSEMMGEPFWDVYKNVDAYNKANFPNLQNQKGWWEATKDMLTVGNNNVKLGNLGQQLMKAHRENDTELAASLMSEIDALNQTNMALQGNIPDKWWKEAVECGAQSAPFMGYVAGAGILGNFIAPVAGTTASFAASSYLSAGQEYIDMIANGSTPETARIVSTVSGLFQGAIEADFGITGGLLKSSARLMGKEVSENVARKTIEEIGRKAFKRFHFGAGKKAVANFALNYAENVFGEGMEEASQNVVSVLGKELAAVLDGYDLPDDDIKTIVKDTMNEFKGGLLGAVVLGVLPTGFNAAADVKDFATVGKLAEKVDSKEAFYNGVKDSKLFEGMTDEAKKNSINEIWERGQQRKEERANAEAKRIQEIQDAAEGAEELKTDNEGEEVEASPVTRDDKTGRLFTQDDVFYDEEKNPTGGRFVVGDNKTVTKKDGEEGFARYGYINWEFADKDQSKIIINDFKIAKGREGIRAEVYNDFAIQHPGVDIQWNTKESEAQAVKEQLIADNPSGAKNGLNYYADENAVADASTRAWVDKQIAEHITDYEIVNNKYVKTKLSKERRAAAVALLEAAAKRQNMSLTDYVNKTFGNQIFGDTRELQQAALAQAKEDLEKGNKVTRKAGGVDVGTAQQGEQNWKKFGQQVKAVIYAGENADFSTWVHELAHIFQNQLDGDLKAQAEAAFGVIDGDWENSMYTFADGKTVMPAAEAFAYGFQDWLKTGKAENEQMKNIFQKFAEFVARAFNSMKDFINLTPEITDVYNQLLSGDDSLLKAAEMAVEAEDRRYRAQMQQQEKEAEIKKQTEAEQQKKAEEAEREEMNEITDFEEEEKETTPEEAETKLDEVANEKKAENETNAIDNALENSNLTDEQKTQISDVLNDESTTVEEKAEAVTDAASSAYDKDNTATSHIIFQLAGEPSIRRMAESEERERILADLDAAQLLDEKYKNMDAASKAARIKRATGWEKDASGNWKYELDDSLNRIKTEIFKTHSGLLRDSAASTLLNLSDIYDAPELYKVFPYMKNVRVNFYSDPNAFRAVLTPQGIMVNTKYLKGFSGENGLKGVLAHEIQHVIQAMEFADSKGLQGQDLRQLYNDVMDAMKAAGERRYNYDTSSMQAGLDAYMNDAGEIEARNVARRILMNADARRMNTLASTEDVERQIQFQDDFTEIGESEWGTVYEMKNNNPLEAAKFLMQKKDGLIKNLFVGKNKNGNTYKVGLCWGDEETGLYKILNKHLIKYKDFESVEEIVKTIKNILDNGRRKDYKSKAELNNGKYKLILAKGENGEFVITAFNTNSEETKERTEEEKELKREELNLLVPNSITQKGTPLPETASGETIAQESEAVKQKYQNTDKWLKAPNGEDSNLDEKQWVQVRTPSFKKWFGDWENDPTNASKVLDENGEPLVVYHGTDADFTIFDASKSRANMDIQGNFFSPWDIDAQGYGPNVRAFYLNIRNPSNSSQGYSALNTFKGQNEAGIKARELLKSKGFDGVNNDNEEYITFEPNQIKSATDNNGNFDVKNPDILFQIAGEIGAENLDNSEVQEGVSRMQNLAIAKQMDADRKTAKTIRLATGWEKDDDGKWKYEIADFKLKDNPTWELKKNEQGDYHVGTLKDLIDAPELFRAYPELRDYTVHTSLFSKDYVGQYSNYLKEISLNNSYEKTQNNVLMNQIKEIENTEEYKNYKAAQEELYKKQLPTDADYIQWEKDLDKLDEDFYSTETGAKYKELLNTPRLVNGLNPEILSTLIHEVQHAIQSIEGFAKGGTEEYARTQANESIKYSLAEKQLSNWYPYYLREESAADFALQKKRIMKNPELIKKTGYWMAHSWAVPKKGTKDYTDYLYDRINGWMQETEAAIVGDDGYGRIFKDWYKKPEDELKKIRARNKYQANKYKDLYFKIYNLNAKQKEYDALSNYELYQRLAGEVEARNVQTRRNFTDEQRLNTLLKETEDVEPRDKIILFQTVYHGSGADFDKFDTENFGLSGEGSMSFGYGTYVTEEEDIARWYADGSTDAYVSDDVIHELYESLTSTYKINYDESELKSMTLRELIDFIGNGYFTKETFFKWVDKLKANADFNNSRNLYTVEIPDIPYLQWNQEVNTEEVKRIKDLLFTYLINKNENKVINTFDDNGNIVRVDIADYSQEKADRIDTNKKYTGNEIYKTLSSIFSSDLDEEGAKSASKFLSSIGYSGIKYQAGMFSGKPRDAYNYVIFNDDDAKIVNHLFFQTEAELQDEALSFGSWQDFMEYCETFHAGDAVSPIPFNSDAQWYQTFWETAHGIQAETEKNEQAVTEKVKEEGILPNAVDALFKTYLRTYPEMIDNFLKAVAEIDAIDLDSEEWQQVADAEDAKERERIDQLKDFINITLSDYNWQTAIKRIQSGNEIAEGLRKRLIGEMTDNFKVRDFRAIYADVMDDEQFAVDEKDSITSQLNKKLSKYQKRYYDILRPNEDIARVSPERRKRIAEAMQNRDIAAKIKNGTLKLDDEVETYIKSLDKQIDSLQKEYNELEKETKNDYQRLADAKRRKLLKLHEELLLASGKMKKRDAEIERKIKKGLKVTEKYRRESQNMTANYDELFRKFTDLKNTIQITAEVQAALDRQDRVAGLKDELNAKQKEKNLTAEVKKMRIQLVKRTMRRVPFNRVDYENARTVIAIQRMLEPNLLGGVNRFIGIDSAYLRGVVSQLVTDSEYKEKILSYIRKQDKSSQAFVNFLKKIEELKSIKDFDSWTAKERKYAIKHLPKENWVRDLNLQQLAKEREESIDLDIGMTEKQQPRIDPKTGDIMRDKEGNVITETAFVLDAADELKKLVKDAVGADMFDNIVNKPFSEWTTEELEQLAQRIDEIYTEGRDLYAAKQEARKRENDRLRKIVEDAIKETGIVINDDDTPEEKERKTKQIEKILNQNSNLAGTEAGKNSGINAKFDRIIHGYQDANILRVARILDNQSEGINYKLLYRMEDDCFNNKTRAIMQRGETVKKIMADNKITEGSLAESIEVSQLGTSFTVDELLYFLAADKDFEIDERKVKPDASPLDINDDYAATSRNAVMFGNMMSDSASQELKESWAQLDKDMQEAIENDTLTQEQKEALAIGQLDKRPGTTKFIKTCKGRWEACLSAANTFLAQHPEYNALLEAIEADYAEQYERMNEISINEFNTPVHRVKAYVPLVRRESNGDTNVNQVKEDLLGAYGAEAGKQWVNKGMTQRRVNISPLNQKPIQTGLFRTWGDSIDRTEHFIAYAPYVRQLNAIYKSRDANYTRRFIEARYGKQMTEYIDSYINEVANPNANKIRERGAEFLHVLRGKTAPAYLGWKFSGIVKQGLTSPWPYMQFVNPAEYLAAATKCWTHGGKVYDAIKSKSAYMASRVMDPINELVDEMADNAKSKVDRAWSKFAKTGMQGLEWIDWTCVAPGWLACYQKEYNRLQNMSEARYQEKIDELTEKNMTAEIGTSEWMSREQIEAQAKQELMDDIESEAVRYADDCTRACQPSSRLTDLAPLFKNSSEAMKAFLQFQTSLNVIWQNIRYDIPYNIRQKEFKKIVGTVCGYIFAGIFMNSVMDGVRGDDDDDDTQALRNLIYYSTTQFTDAVPMIGSELTNVMDKVITGKRAYSQSGTDMTPSATKLLSALQKVTNGDFKKAAELTAEGIGLGLGAPVSGVKEINRLLGKPLSEGEINIKKGVGDVYGIAGDIIGE